MNPTPATAPAAQTLLEIAGNLAHFHREHEKYYARAPLRQAVDLQATSDTLKALAERWQGATPTASSERSPSPYAGARDLNDTRAIETSGVLFMEGGSEPAEIGRIRRELDTAARDSHEAGEWLATAMDAAWGVAAALLQFPDLADLLAQRHSIIANDMQYASMLMLSGRQLSRAREILDCVDFTVPALREDMDGPHNAPSYLFSAAELIDQAADLSAQGAVLVHRNERKWRVFAERVTELTSGVTTDP